MITLWSILAECWRSIVVAVIVVAAVAVLLWLGIKWGR